jgi:hypothetical protein
MKNKSIVVPILNDEYSVYVYIGDTKWAKRVISKYLDGEEGVSFGECNRGKCLSKIGYHPCIWVDPNLKGKQFSATLAHEAVHAVTHIIEYLAMNGHDQSGNEFLAHGVGAILRKCLR